MTEIKYIGSELELFRNVHNWKQYWSSQVLPYIQGEVLEVGAGIGANTALIDKGTAQRWTCLEPDPQLFAAMQQELAGGRQELICGTVGDLDGRLFDTLIYIDVLEHIEDDHGELRKAAAHLRRNGRVIVLSPAHQRLFTPFDSAIGHFRRYNSSMVRQATPPELRLDRLRYLDSFGLLASTANLLLLRQSMPTAAQLGVWDNWIVPVSRVIDPVAGFKVGKSILAVWSKS